MSRMIVWAFEPIAELNDETGWVECEEALGRQLISEGKVQDPAVGALALREVRTVPRAYETTHFPPESEITTDLVPPKGRRRAR